MNLISILLVILIIAFLIGFSQIETLLKKLNNRIDNLSKDFDILEKTLEENKPKKLYKVKVKYYEDGKVKTKTLLNVYKIKDYGENPMSFIKKCEFFKEGGEFTIQSKDLINYESELM